MMIGKLLTTTALAAVISTSAFAQATAPAPAGQSTTALSTTSTETTVPSAMGNYVDKLGADEFLASDLTGATLYQSADANSDEAGEIQNFLIDRQGKVVAAIVDTGSFLDAGKVVAVPPSKINFGNNQDDDARPVLTASREELMAAPAFTETTAADAVNGGAMAPATGLGAVPATGTTTGAAAPDPASTAVATPSAGAQASAPMAASTGKYGYVATVGSDQRLSEDIIGSDVYGGPGQDATSIGSVNDLVLTKSGTVAAAVIGVGGFLGVGEKDVGVPFKSLTVANGQGDETRTVLAATKEQLSAAPAFFGNDQVAESASGNAAGSMAKSGAATGAALGTAAGTAAGTALDSTRSAANGAANSAGRAMDTATGTATTTAQSTLNGANGGAADATTTASTGGASDRASMTPATGADLSTEAITGTTIYGPNDENIGSVSDLALTTEGKVDAVIIDVGGFLGIGQKSVAVAMDNLQFMKDNRGSLYLYTQFTKDQLKNAPEYNKDTYAENRNTMRIMPGTTLPSSAPADGAAAPAK